MASIKIIRTNIIFRGDQRDPHLRNAFFPSVVELPNGKLVAAMDIGGSMTSHDVRSYVCTSVDGGLSWSSPRPIFDPGTRSGPCTTTCRISRTHDGQVAGLAGITDRSNGGMTVNPLTDGHVETQLAIVRSADGELWSQPRALRQPLDWPAPEVAAPILALRSDRWLWPASLFADWEGRNPHGLKGIVAVSEDEGRSWARTVDVFDFRHRSTVAWEQKLTRLADGRILSVCWAFNTASKTDEPNAYALSCDQGDSFGLPRATPLHGQTCSIVALEDNVVLAVYRRMDRRGLWAHLARIEGERWLPLDELLLWGRQTAALPEHQSSALGNLHNLRFGYPSLVRLQSGDVLCAFWGEEDNLMVVRSFLLQICGA